jgi:short-subunit dehydrogenase
MSQRDGQKQMVLITGASSGLGLDLARLFAADGCNLVLTARREAELATLAAELSARHGVTCHRVCLDLGAPGAPARLLDEAAVATGGANIDVLVNNAGFGLYGRFSEMELPRLMEMVHLNVTTLTDLSRRLLPGMLARRQGGILNVASTAAFQSGPLMAAYYATKAYVLSLSEAIAEEVSGSGVTVTCLCPGPTATGFQATAGISNLQMLKGPFMMTSAEVSRAGHEGFRAGRRVVIPGAMNKLAAQSSRFLPRRLMASIVHKVQEK